jgi:hypothetical protein
MQLTNHIKNSILLLLIIVTGSVLRFWNFAEIPFTHDEFSAIFRLQYNNFSALIANGIMRDGHPAGIQVFLYYWTKLFGISEPIVKFPFIMMGILSIWILYLIGKEWFNETVGLVSASFLASLQFSVMNSQIARPYVSGLFFCLLMVYFWTKLVFKSEEKFKLNALMYIFSAALCSYNHYFSLLFAIIVGLSGLIYIRREYLLKYIISGTIIFMLFIPHFKIFLYQVKIGGIGDWLGKPHPDFIISYIAYIFQFSLLSVLLSVLIILFGVYKLKRKEIKTNFFFISIIFFLLPFIIGYLYSIFINSVLQYNVLFFSFPFLFFILFGHLKLEKPLINMVLVASILLINIMVLVFQRQHYSLFYNSPYERILTVYEKMESINKNALAIIDSDKKISHYYISKYHIDTNFTSFSSLKDEKGLVCYLTENYEKADKLYFGCLSGSNPLIIPIIMDFYPNIEWQKNYFGGTSYLFSKSKNRSEKLIENLDLDKVSHFWSNVDQSKIITIDSMHKDKAYLIDSLSEWSPTFTKSLDEIMVNENNFIDVSVRACKPDSLCGAVLSTSISKGEKVVYWDGHGFDTFICFGQEKRGWITIHHCVKLSDIDLNYNNLELKVYIWNKGKENLIIDDFKIELRDGNPMIYGLFEKF